MHDACISIEWKGPIVVGPVKESFPILLEVSEEGEGESILIAPFVDGFRAHINRSPLREVLWLESLADDGNPIYERLQRQDAID